MIDKFMRYPVGNTLAVIVLIALIITWVTSLVLSLRNTPVRTDKGWFAWILPVFALLGIPPAIDLLQTKGITLLFAGIAFVAFVLNIVIPILHARGQSSHPLVTDWHKWAIPVLVIAGLAVSGYLTFVEAKGGGGVVCGPLGGCEEVQTSKYATLFGFLSVGLLGFLGNIAILAAWIAWQFGPAGIKKMSALAIWGLCIFGVLFSTYLTFLEPFVIGATCMWCLSSAVIMILLLLASTPAAQQALAIAEEE
ncbi:MAG TPA: vitamin K epoxide reductase family protein [Anaerolineales bacterium]|nr:vitamin K epoxide reductase family protein [Anaerolineales bacterium]